jgi:hypothetical protein
LTSGGCPSAGVGDAPLFGVFIGFTALAESSSPAAAATASVVFSSGGCAAQPYTISWYG